MPTDQQKDHLEKYWTDALGFFLHELKLSSATPLAQNARFQDYLESRHEADVAEFLWRSVNGCYNWMCHHWSYLKDVGLVTADGHGIQNCLLGALREVALDGPIELLNPPYEAEPIHVVRIAQKYMDAAKNPDSDAP